MSESEITCDICGRPIFGNPIYKFVEGAKLKVCQNCSKFGKSIKSPKSIKPRSFKRKKKVYRRPKTTDDFYLIEDFGKTIKEARERKKLTQNEFASMLKEPLSLIRRIEQNKLHPSFDVIKKIENLLNIKVTEKDIEEEIPKTRKVSKSETTIGDIAEIKKKKE